MKTIKAVWVQINPFSSNGVAKTYYKVIRVADNTDMTQLEKYAIEDSTVGYRFRKFEQIDCEPLKDLRNQSTDMVEFTGTIEEVMTYIHEFHRSRYDWSLCLQGFFTAANGDEYVIENN